MFALRTSQFTNWVAHSPRLLNRLSYLGAGQAHSTSMTSRTEYNTSTPQKPTYFDGHYLRKRSTLDIGVLGYIGIVWPKEHSPEVSHIPPVTPCIHIHGVPGGMCQTSGVFLVLKYTDITQNTYIQSWTVTEIMAREKWGLLAVPNTATCTAESSR
jgi:hypothetical protein